MAEQYRIGEFARLSGVGTKKLRFYDEIGLLRPAKVNPLTNYRYYVAEQLEQLASIQSLQEIGLSLSEIQRLLGTVDLKKRRRFLEDLKSKTEEAIISAERSLALINASLTIIGEPLPMNVVVKHRPALRVASTRVSGLSSYDDITPVEQELQRMFASEIRSGSRGVLWHSCADSGTLEAEPFMEIAQPMPRRNSFDIKILPAVTVACAYSKGDKDSEPAYDAIKKWMEVRGYRLAGPKREIYLGPLLEIQFPLRIVD